MNTRDILEALDSEIARLEKARNAIAGLRGPRPRSRQPASTVALKTLKRRTISAAGRKRIAEAQRKRWAEARKAKA